MLLSTFELLLKPITPTPGTINNSDRIVLQGYFLNIANPNNVNLRLRLRFNATTPGLNNSELIAIRDTTGGNVFGNLNAQNEFNFTLSALDTGLVILQPDITSLDSNTANLEFRGYVEIFVVERNFFPFPTPCQSYPLLVTPEHRGTFLPSPNSGTGEFDQLINSLPTATGGSLMDVDVIREPIIINPPSPTVPIPPSLDQLPQPSPDLVDIQQALNFMAQRIDDLSQQTPDLQET